MGRGISRILILGGGLLGTSFALAVHRACPDAVIECVEQSPEHRAKLTQYAAIAQVYSDVTDVDSQFDLAVLAASPDVCISYLQSIARHASIVLDVCSVKRAICEAADDLCLRSQFVPSHPMAGKAIEGPSAADGELFRDRPWIFLEDWAPPATVLALIERIGARVTMIPSAEAHDGMVACVSHGIHVTSLAAMLTSEEKRRQTFPSLVEVSGPAFWDITRLASSPAAFWADTLLQNRENVIPYLQTLREQIANFEEAMRNQDRDCLVDLLNKSKIARETWESSRP
ncbi:prephenate dehydrogenase/arogenate dehydrogenase family protein [Alicyclobacillus fastidiosus]|uniref:Prephenate dehydrogenase/arogenate dehydrogenase family protein n=1 Tax=Alicyclobacillus fastidiosus TaxID=392011 RepID=A0ABY6ZBP2_9BACL|nr:prephenate dehydrogenase/arogenate dehydrogenase family protein [Alicyclobacillus fastidiosus]WAH39666.1 prephenate dehydrogenase/arogenate dehydrogenase family protein [Alicyclobacillus fastidiosus]GMA60876.1 cyclohexadienyl dehydrogenase [Alicyclobacillus fastidiosus]